jgi:glucose dehydrogenase
MINKLTHKVILVSLSPIFIYFGIKNIYFPINIFFIICGLMFIYIGNNSFRKDGNLLYLFEILIIGPLLFLLGYTKNKYEHLKNLLSVIGICILIYYGKTLSG